LLLLCLGLSGIVIAGLFPELKVVDEGIKYRYLSLLTGTIVWAEIEALAEPRFLKGVSALIISRQGYNFFKPKGLFVNRLYGQLFGFGEPIILVSPGMDNYRAIIKKIQENIKKSPL
jgi:hypothetical protein